MPVTRKFLHHRQNDYRSPTRREVINQTMQRELHNHIFREVDVLCKKFEQLGLLISKDKPKKNIQDITYHKCKNPGHYSSQC